MKFKEDRKDLSLKKRKAFFILDVLVKNMKWAVPKKRLKKRIERQKII